LGLDDELTGAQVRDGVAFEGGLMVEVEFLDSLAGGESGCADTDFGS
jgi:hypothetical protein